MSRTARATTSGNQLHLAAETGYDFKAGAVIAGPKLSLHYVDLQTRTFTESNAGALNLTVARQSAASLQTGLGGRLAYTTKIGSVPLTPQVYAVWQHEYSDRSRGLNASLAQSAVPFIFRTDAPQRDFAVLGVEVAARCSKRFTARVGYNAEVGRGGSFYQGVTAGLRVEF
ncbi:autotransporter outer membrane beta-barrel domain-containing protein [Desulfobacca acetoxidans]